MAKEPEPLEKTLTLRELCVCKGDFVLLDTSRSFSFGRIIQIEESPRFTGDFFRVSVVRFDPETMQVGVLSKDGQKGLVNASPTLSNCLEILTEDVVKRKAIEFEGFDTSEDGMDKVISSPITLLEI